MQDTRQRRGHRACEPCRRKKARCPGERPICSFCRRLGQHCNYESAGPDNTQNLIMDRRMVAIEGKLDQLLQSLDQPPNSSPAQDPGLEGSDCNKSKSVPSLVNSTPLHSVGVPQEDISDAWIGEKQSSVPSQSRDQILDAGKLYLKWCHNQPLVLFRPEAFLTSLESRDPELCLAIQALSSRFPPGTMSPLRQQVILATAKSCRATIMRRVANGSIRLSTLQTLCILSLISFSEGNVMQAGLDLQMAQYFVNSLPSDSFLGDDPAECYLCIQTILLLQSIHGCVYDAAKAAVPGSLFGYSRYSTSGLTLQPNATPLFGRLLQESDLGSGIIAHVALAAEAWKMARAYAAYQVGPDELPPWDPNSDYSLIMLRHMELDAQYPLKYRFAMNNFGAVSSESLHQRRDYWGPWLFQQFAFAAIPSLVNHPFLLSMRLKNFRHMMPTTFIHQSFDHISRHSAWIMYFLDLIEKQRFEVSDPLLAHCVVIVATIHLQHSFVKEDTLRQKAQSGYNKCLRFLDRMGQVWPCVFSMASTKAQNLRRLQETITMVSYDASRENQSPELHRTWNIDAKLLWDILIYERAGRPSAAADRSMFGERITLEDHPEQDVTEFAMLGSAGISGHRTVAKEVVAYAPDDDESSNMINPSSTPTGPPLGSVELSNNGLFSAAGHASQMMDGSSSFLQPVDFGAAIRNWFEFDMSY